MIDSFEQTTIDAAYEAIKRENDGSPSDNETKNLSTPSPLSAETAEEFTTTVAGGCIAVRVQNGQICLKLPVVGNTCLPIPSTIPNGTVAEACLHICSTLGFPTGVKVTVSVAGHQVVSRTFGKC